MPAPLVVVRQNMDNSALAAHLYVTLLILVGIGKNLAGRLALFLTGSQKVWVVFKESKNHNNQDNNIS